VIIADGHADSLMWNRDLNQASSEGHVDFPRLQQAGVRLQCFTVVTRGFPFIGGFPLFAAYRGWPAQARRGEWARATWQIDRLAEFCRRSGGQVSIATSAAALEENLGDPRSQRISAVIGIEGAHALEGQVARVRDLHARGVRFMSLTHLDNNELGGSSFPFMGNRGLTQLGRDVLNAMVEVGMSIDLAHASVRTLDDVFSHSKARFFCSHTGVYGVAPTWRNLTDSSLRKIADRGGVAAIIFATIYLGGEELLDVVRHIEHAVHVMGEDGVALGSDFDGMIPLPRGMRDVRDLPQLAEALRKRGHPEARVEKILGGNFRRFFRETLG
jgi:membrane dipeptidase